MRKYEKRYQLGWNRGNTMIIMTVPINLNHRFTGTVSLRVNNETRALSEKHIVVLAQKIMLFGEGM